MCNLIDRSSQTLYDMRPPMGDSEIKYCYHKGGEKIMSKSKALYEEKAEIVIDYLEGFWVILKRERCYGNRFTDEP